MRYVIPILVVLGLVGGLVYVKASQIGSLIAFGEQMKKAGPPPETIATATATTQSWDNRLFTVGSVTAGRGVTVSNDAAGVVTAIRFESGKQVRKGDVLVELDTSVERATLASAIARRDLAETNLKRTSELRKSDAIGASQVENDEAALRSANADVEAIQAQIERKVVKAPFAGRLGIRQVNIGQYVNPGTPLTVLQSLEGEYVDFTVPQQRLPEIRVGLPVTMTISGEPGKPLEGEIVAIDPTLDEVSRAVKVRAACKDPEDRLHPGMFVTVSVTLSEAREVVTVPVTALVHASYGDSVFVVEQAKPDPEKPNEPTDKLIARQQFVRSGETRGDFVVIQDGITAGQQVVTAGAFKLRNGSPVLVNNAVGATPELHPQPKNR